MTKKLFIKTIGVWFILTFLAVLNGSARVFLYGPKMSNLLAHQISTFIFVAVVLVVAYIFIKRQEDLSNKTLILIGSIWVLFTEIFEFLAGHYLFGNSWEKLFADYNIFQGRIWILVLLITFFAPYLVGLFLRKNKSF